MDQLAIEIENPKTTKAQLVRIALDLLELARKAYA